MDELVTRRGGLGRGLDALLPSGDRGDFEVRVTSSLREVAVADIEANPNQPRRRFDDAAMDDLVASVKELGILQPLLVREVGGDRYQLVAGERRWRAAAKADLATVPVLVIDTDDRGSLERALVENIHRENLNPIEEAAGYAQLIEEGGLTQEELGRRLGRNRVTIANSLRLLELPDEIKHYLIDGRMSARHGRTLLPLQNNPFQVKLAQRVVHEGLSVRETEDHVSRYQSLVPRSTGARGGREQPPLVAEAQRRLADHLQTRVRVEMGKRKGKMTIEFVSTEELERLLEVMLGRTAGARPSTASPDPD